MSNNKDLFEYFDKDENEEIKNIVDVESENDYETNYYNDGDNFDVDGDNGNFSDENSEQEDDEEYYEDYMSLPHKILIVSSYVLMLILAAVGAIAILVPSVRDALFHIF